MNSDRRLSEIRRDLETALDSEEEYLEEGAMGTDWTKSWAAYAASELQSLFKASEPTAEEIACCVEAISNPERIRKGRSKQLLLQLREQSHPILDALANSTDPQLRIFAIETAVTCLNPPYFGFLYMNLWQRLLNDPNENIRIATILASRQTIAANAYAIQTSLVNRTTQGWIDFFHQLLARLNDPSAKVRTAAAAVLRVWATHLGYGALGGWAAYIGHEALDVLLDHENDVEARKALEKGKVIGNLTPYRMHTTPFKFHNSEQ